MSTAFLFNNKMMKYGTHVMGISSSPTPPDYNPLNLPANTVRVRTSDGLPPSKGPNYDIYPIQETSYDTATLVTGTSDVYDVYKAGTSFEYLLLGPTGESDPNSNVVEVLGANTEGITNMNFMFRSCKALTTVALFDTRSVTDMQGMFQYCRSLTSVPLYDLSATTNMKGIFSGCRALTTIPQFDTHNVVNMQNMFYNDQALVSVPLLDTGAVTGIGGMFYECRSLTSLPLFDTSSVYDIEGMCYNCQSVTAIPLFDTSGCTNKFSRVFYNCYKVETGALALYQQVSAQSPVPSSHGSAFTNCGRDTVTGAAELAQIPSSWGGTGA